MASDPGPLQDFCVAVKDIKDGVFVNGKICKDPKLADSTLSAYLWLGSTTLLMALTLLTLIPRNRDPSPRPRHSSRRLRYINPDYRLFTKILNPGDVFVFPMGLIHFQFNVGKSKAVAFGGLSSQNAGVISIANAAFGSNPSINPDVLAKAFQLDKDVVKDLQSKF
ncbi:RmlC-like cupins superfamily protein [Hibiscus syriacus]|uniref:Germin-like protein n=1 Tax=Hibiscus syriacus TaxID=106335 RepID=A0A6A3BVN2_HIBSY|nr:RmlC-like cupins superfamily protein [Hibiscus syriacus]